MQFGLVCRVVLTADGGHCAGWVAGAGDLHDAHQQSDGPLLVVRGADGDCLRIAVNMCMLSEYAIRSEDVSMSVIWFPHCYCTQDPVTSISLFELIPKVKHSRFSSVQSFRTEGSYNCQNVPLKH